MLNDVSPRKLTVVIAGGGTGGHLIPGIAVARELRSRGVGRIVFIGTARGLETRLVPSAGFDLHLVSIGGLKNVGFRRTLQTLSAAPRSVLEAVTILGREHAAIVFGIGGYASGPALLAAAWLGIPVVVLETNARTGLANRLASPWVREAAVAFPQTARDFRRAEVTGVPVRPEFFSAPLSDRRGRQAPRIVLFGGSQGARALNDVAPEAVRIWREAGWGFHLTHQTGPAAYNVVRDSYAKLALPALEREVDVVPFIDDMPAVMAGADLVISRSGASTLGELAAAGKPAILVPFPGAADNHQLSNALAFERAGAAVVIQQSQVTPEGLARQVQELLGDRTKMEAMSAAARKFGRPNAAGAIADLVLRNACLR
jgi:UDP-N-acetylglucosamine--N-acetylmuramyl-(pentapeptide) pyrophosphoryl-undecaprenol N-acetylglucosamine transferase